MDDHRHLRGLDLVEDEIRLRGAVQDDADVELFRDPERVHDVDDALRGDEERQLLLNHFAQRLEAQVA